MLKVEERYREGGEEEREEGKVKSVPNTEKRIENKEFFN
jgi:hypothetical protein